MPVNSVSSHVPSSRCWRRRKSTPRAAAGWPCVPRGDQAQQGPGGLRRGGRSLAAQLRVGVAVGRFAPAAAGLLMRQAANSRPRRSPDRRRHADRRQPDQRLPGAVDVVDAPAAEPTAVGLLRACADRRRPDRPPDRPRAGPAGPAFRARGRSGRACSDRSSRCDRQTARGRGTRGRCRDRRRPSRRRDSACASIQSTARSHRAGQAIERGHALPCFARARHGTLGRSPTRSLRLAARAPSDAFDLAAQGHHDHGRVVDVGIERRWRIRSTSRPARPSTVSAQSPASADFLREQPLDRALRRPDGRGSHAAGRPAPAA